jgi:histidine phosphotransfer protein HptB
VDPIRSVYEDDPDMREIVQEFVEDLKERTREIEQALANRSYDQLRTLAHQLKGAGGGYGFDAITDSAGQLEHALKEGADDATIEGFTRHLCETLGAVVIGERN